MSKYRYCLRINLVPGFYENERTSALIDFCVKYKIDDVIFIINCEEFNNGHITKDEAKIYINLIKKVKNQLDELNITTSINLWETFLHADAGRKLKEGQNFSTMADVNGKHADAVVCPFDKNWQDYFFDLYEYIISEINPDTIWLEDDFRFHNHSPLEFGGCFCERHLKEYGKITGAVDDAKTFSNQMVKGENQALYRKAYMELNNELLCSISQKFAERTKNYNLKIGLMTSDPHMHAIEGRNYNRLFGALSKYKNVKNRIHLPSYRQATSLEYFWNLNYISILSKSFTPENVDIYPEIESFPNSPFSKNPKNVAFQIMASLPLSPKGITMNLFEFCGNGVIDEWGYGKEILKIKDYVNSFVNMNTEYSQLCGIIVPISEETVMNMKLENGNSLYELYNNDNWWGSYLASAGIIYTYSFQKNITGKTLAISGQYLRNLNREEIVSLFINNKIMIDAECLLTLCDLGLSELINVKSYRKISERTGYNTFEQADNGQIYFNLEKPRAQSQYFVGDFYKIDYIDSDKVEILSNQYNYNSEKVCSSVTIVNGNVAILPYHNGSRAVGLLQPMRLKMIADIAKSFDTNVIINDLGIAPFLFRQKDKDILLLINYFDQDKENISFLYDKLITEIFIYTTEFSNGKKAEFKFEKGKYCLNEKISSESSIFLIIK